MADNLNYGPHLSIGNLWQLKDSKIESATNKSAFTSSISTRDEISSVASSLGSHWKQVATVANSFENSDASSDVRTARSEDPKLGKRSSSSSSSSTLVESDLQGTEKINRELDKMEMKSNLQVQNINLDKVYKILKQDIRKFKSTVRRSNVIFDGIFDDWILMNDTCCETLDRLENEQDVFESDTDLDIENMIDITEEITGVIKDRNSAETFLATKSDQIAQLSTLPTVMSENLKRINTIHQLLDYNRIDLPPLTSFEHDDGRVHDVMSSMTKWIGTLPLSLEERQRIDSRWQLLQGLNGGMDGAAKCAQMFDTILGLMQTWNEQIHQMTSTSSSASGSGSVSPTRVFESSSFALSDGNDSNLNDIAAELAQARTKMAVEGPKNCIEMSSWSTASKISNWSNLSDGHSSYQSIQEPMTLSSYDFESGASSASRSDGTMTSSSIESQMPSWNRHELDVQLKTALSQDDVIDVKNPPRSTNCLEEAEQETEPTTKLDDLLDEALHTARSLIESNSISLYDALQESAKKCGVAVESLLSQSSSGVSESATQSSEAESMNLQ